MEEKGHGTKTFFNSRQIEVFSESKECIVIALMSEPMASLLKGQAPRYDYDLEERSTEKTGTKIKIYGYNNNKKKDFEHRTLKDYILWFSKFGCVEREFGIDTNADRVIKLRGLGAAELEDITLGHRFATERSDIKKLREKVGSDWTKKFVKKWVFKNV